MNRRVKNTLAGVLLWMGVSLIALGVSSCGPNLPTFIQQAQSYEQTAQIVLSDAQIAWSLIKPFLSQQQQVDGQVLVDKAIFAVNHALTVFNDAIQIAIDAGQSSPDLTGAMQAVQDAVSAVLAVINNFKSSAPPQLIAQANIFSDMEHGIAQMKRIAHTH